MPNEVLIKSGQASAIKWGSGTTHALSLGGLINGAYQQGAKGDLGPLYARAWAVNVRLTTAAVAPATDGEVVEIYWAASTVAPGTSLTDGNQGGTSGSDEAYLGYNATDNPDESAATLTLLGAVPLTVTASTAHNMVLGQFTPPTQYGMPVVANKLGGVIALDATNTNHYVELIPLTDEIQ
jgi:hypothetical protein